MRIRDDQCWAEFLGVDPSEWASSGVSVRAHVGLVGYRGLWCFHRGARAVVSVPVDWVAPLSAKLDRCEPEALFDETFLVELLGGDFERLIGPAFQGCLEVGAFRPTPSVNVRFIGRNDSAAVDRFRAECGADEWESGGLDEVKHHMAAYFDGNSITAMSGYRSLERPRWRSMRSYTSRIPRQRVRYRGCEFRRRRGSRRGEGAAVPDLGSK